MEAIRDTYDRSVSRLTNGRAVSREDPGLPPAVTSQRSLGTHLASSYRATDCRAPVNDGEGANGGRNP